MPIRPENKSRYPANWKSEVVPRIRARSGNRCECTGQCGVEHGHSYCTDLSELGRCGIDNGDVSYMIDGRWQVCLESEVGDEMERRNGKKYHAVRIVLTVMHLDHQPENCADENLLHACQGCHNRYDAPMRRRGIEERVREKRASGDLFKCEAVSS
jgi:hypothetical protein